MSDAKLTATVTCDASQAIAAFQNYQKAVGGAVQANAKATTSLKSTGQAVTDFSRVIQDAPFGFVAIQNNINPLIESFGRLKAEAASTGQSLAKTLISALSGPGGFGLAVAAASSALVLFTNGFGAWTRGFSSTKKATDESKDSVDSWTKSIESAANEVGRELGKVDRLIASLKDETNTRKERAEALKELNKIAPEYFAGLDAEKSSIEQITAAYDKYYANVIKIAKAKALGSEIDKEAAKIVTAELNKQTAEQQLSLTALAKQDQFIGKTAAGAKAYTEQLARGAAAQKDLDAANKSIAESNAKIANYAKIINDLDIKSLDLTKDKKKGVDELEARIKALQELLSKGLLDLNGKDELINLRAQLIVRDQTKNHFTDAEVQKLIDDLDFEINGKLRGKEINLRSMGVNFDPETIDTSKALKGIKGGSVFTIPVDVNLKLRQKAIDRAFKQFNDSIVGAAENAFSGLGDALGQAIGDSISGKGFQDAFKSFGHIISNFIKQIADSFIKLGVELLVVNKAIKSGQPLLMIAGGIALAALSATLENQLSSATPFAKGGIVTGPTNALIGEAGPEVVFPLNQLNRFIRTNITQGPQRVQVEGVISGNNILLANRRAQKNQNLYTRG